MTYYVSSGTLNPTHSLTHLHDGLSAIAELLVNSKSIYLISGLGFCHGKKYSCQDSGNRQ